MMKIPAFLHGSFRDVSRASRQRAKMIVKGAALVEPGEPVLDTIEVDGLVAVQRCNYLLGSHFFVGVLECEIADAGIISADEHLRLSVFEQLVATAWGVAACMGPVPYYLRTPTNLAKLIRACARSWDELHAVGKRFTAGPDEGMPFWTTASALHYALARSGLVSREDLLATNPDPYGYVPLAQARGLVDRWLAAQHEPN